MANHEIRDGRDDFADVSTGNLSRKYERYANMLKTGIPSSEEMLLTWEYLEEIGDQINTDILRQNTLIGIEYAVEFIETLLGQRSRWN